MVAEHTLVTPIREEKARELRFGDLAYISGVVYVWRDRAFDYMFELIRKGKPIPIDPRDGVHWHCGPIAKKMREKWMIVSAGPTSSNRMDNEEPTAILKWGVRLVIGKGLGMGPEVMRSLMEVGGAYLSAVGGAAAYYAKKITSVRRVLLLKELGMPEAIWVLNVKDLGPLLVSMDSQGRNLYEEVNRKVLTNIPRLYKEFGIELAGKPSSFQEIAK